MGDKCLSETNPWGRTSSPQDRADVANHGPWSMAILAIPIPISISIHLFTKMSSNRTVMDWCNKELRALLGFQDVQGISECMNELALHKSVNELHAYVYVC